MSKRSFTALAVFLFIFTSMSTATAQSVSQTYSEKMYGYWYEYAGDWSSLSAVIVEVETRVSVPVEKQNLRVRITNEVCVWKYTYDYAVVAYTADTGRICTYGDGEFADLSGGAVSFQGGGVYMEFVPSPTLAVGARQDPLSDKDPYRCHRAEFERMYYQYGSTSATLSDGVKLEDGWGDYRASHEVNYYMCEGGGAKG